MMRTILIIVLGFFIAQNVAAQVDSLIIKLEDYGQMVIISSNLTKEKAEDIRLNKSYQIFYDDFRKIEKFKFEDKNYLITHLYENDERKSRTISVRVIDNDANEFYFQEGKEQSLLAYNFRLELATEKKVFLFLDSINHFDKLRLLDLDSLYLQSIVHFQNQNPKKRIPYMIFYSSTNNKIDTSTNMILSSKSHDYVALYPTFGASIVSTTFAPEIIINADIALRNKGLIHQKFGFSTTFLFLPDKNDFFNISTYNFVSANYYLKFIDKWSHKLSIGYMINGNGSDFSKNTWNAYWQTNVNKIGIKLGSFYTKNIEGNFVVLPSIGFDFDI